MTEISVVICTYNRDRFIVQALTCLTMQTLPKEKFEVIIVDNNSTDNTASLCKAFIAEHPTFNFRYYFEASKGLSFARNRGIKEASSPIIAYIDDDAEAVPGFLESIVNFLTTNAAAAGIGGKVIPKYPAQQEPVWMSKYLFGFVGAVDFGASPRKFEKGMKYPAGCNMTYRAGILEKAGGFNNRLTFRSDDKDIFYRVTAISDEVYYLPAATVHHNIDSHRLQFDNFRKLYLKTGNEEKVRLRGDKGPMAVAMKFVELVAKTGAAALLYLVFAVKGQEPKGRYVWYSQWYTLKGFLQSDVFVR